MAEYQQILKDRGGTLRLEPHGKPQEALVSISKKTGSALGTAVSMDTAPVVSIVTALAADASVADTSITLASALGIENWVWYTLRNADRQEERVQFSNINTTTAVCTIADPEGLKFAYDGTGTPDTLRKYAVIYDISTDVAEAEETEHSYRAQFSVVESEYASVAATGGTTTTITMTDANAANFYIGGTVIVKLDSTTFYHEARTITDKQSAAGTTTLTTTAFSEAPATDDPVWIGELVWYEVLFDVVKQILQPTLTVADILIRWPSIVDYSPTETQGSEFVPQIESAWIKVLRDIRRLSGKRPHLLVGAGELFAEATFLKFLELVGRANLIPAWGREMGISEYFQQLNREYNAELQESLATAVWYDTDEDQALDTLEHDMAIAIRMTR